MTGNNKVWRAPLAGLASVAMLATMGVAAGTASAATPTDTYTITFKSGSSVVAEVKDVWAGDSIANATVPNSAEYSAVKTEAAKTGFLGFTATEDGTDFVDPLSPVTSNVTLYAKYATGADGKEHAWDDQYVKVVYANSSAYENFAFGTTFYVAKRTVLNGQQLPFDKADGKLVKDWTVTTTSSTGKKLSEETVSDLSKVNVGSPEGVATVTIKPKSFEENVKKVVFAKSKNTDSDYGIANAAIDGDGNPNSYTVDGVEGKTVVSPKFISNGADDVPASWQNYESKTKSPAGSEVTVNDGSNSNNKYADADNYGYATVKFDSNGGTKVADQLVALDKTDENSVAFGYITEPTAPTRDGYVFDGWYNGTQLIDFSAAQGTPGNPRITSTSNLTLVAHWRATTSELKVTFRDQTYNGSNADVSVTVKGDDFLSADQAPEWTRKGYILAGWKFNGADFDFDQKVAADVNNGNDFLLYANWVEVNEDAVKAALRYVNGEDTGAQKALFTPGSWSEFSATWKKVNKEYKKAKFDASNREISAEVSAKLVSELSAAWKKLVFVNNENVVPSYRFFNKVNGEHLFTNDAREIASLKANNDWTYENKAFDTIVDTTGAFKKLASFDAAVEGAEGKKDTTVLDQLNEVADPITVGVYRLFNPANGEHLFTTDVNEYNILTGRNWSGEGAVFYAPKYSSTKNVYRLFDPAKGQHLFTLDANEAQILSTKRGWSNEGVVFKAL